MASARLKYKSSHLSLCYLLLEIKEGWRTLAGRRAAGKQGGVQCPRRWAGRRRRQHGQQPTRRGQAGLRPRPWLKPTRPDAPPGRPPPSGVRGRSTLRLRWPAGPRGPRGEDAADADAQAPRLAEESANAPTRGAAPAACEHACACVRGVHTCLPMRPGPVPPPNPAALPRPRQQVPIRIE